MNIYIAIILTSICWGGWPVLARLSNIDSSVSAPIILTFSVIPTLYYYLMYSSTSMSDTVSLSTMTYLIPAAIMLGVGMVTYSIVLTSSAIDLSTSVPIVSAGVLIVTVIGSVVFFGDNIDLRKILGLIALFAGVFLLRP